MADGKRSKLKILVVEDDFMVRQVIRDILEVYGVVDIAVNGEEAVQAFRVAWRREEPYDLICMDIMMPVMDGNEALVKIRDIERSLGIIGPEEVKVIMGDLGTFDGLHPGHVAFLEFAKIGIPLTIVNVTVYWIFLVIL